MRFTALVDALAPDPEAAEVALADIVRTARDLSADPASDPRPEEPTDMNSPTSIAIAALDDQQGVRVLALVVDRAGVLPDAAQAQEIHDRLHEAAADPELTSHLAASSSRPPSPSGRSF